MTLNSTTIQAQLAELQSTALIIVDAQLTIEYLNPSAQSLLNIGKTNGIGSTLKNQLPHNIEAIEKLCTIEHDHRPITLRQIKIRPLHTQDPILIDITASPILNEEEAWILLEILPLESHLKISEEQHWQHSLAAANALGKGLAHEIKNPLGGIRGAAQLLEREQSADHIKEYTSIIIEEVDRLKDLVDQFLHNKPLEPAQHFNIHELLEKTHHILSSEFTTIHWIKDYDPSLPEIHGYKDQLLQACLNIARNALEAMSESNTQSPTLTVKTRANHHATWHSFHNRIALEVSFIDNGPGIPENLKNTLFYPLVTGRPQGTGLGLSTAMTIIEKHQGTIIVDSQKGTTLMQIVLPLTNDAPVEGSA